MSETASQNDTVDLLREEISAISQFGPEALREDVLQKALAEIERLRAALEHAMNTRTPLASPAISPTSATPPEGSAGPL